MTYEPTVNFMLPQCIGKTNYNYKQVQTNGTSPGSRHENATMGYTSVAAFSNFVNQVLCQYVNHPQN